MPVIIKDFSVETETQRGSEAPAQAQGQQVQARPQTARQLTEMLKTAQQRAWRLHAD